MRTNIDIDDALMEQAMKAGPYKTKKDTVEAGLKLLARQAAYREILKWRGKLNWEGEEHFDWTVPESESTAVLAREPKPGRRRAGRRLQRLDRPVSRYAGTVGGIAATPARPG